MTGVAFNDVHDALVTALTAALPDVQVFDGDPLEQVDELSLCIGTERLTSGEPSTAGTFSQEWAQVGIGGDRNETGEVQCVAESYEGGTTPADRRAARASAIALVSRVADRLRDDYALGVPSLLWLNASPNGEVLLNCDDYGSRCIVRFSIAYQARI